MWAGHLFSFLLALCCPFLLPVINGRLARLLYSIRSSVLLVCRRLDLRKPEEAQTQHACCTSCTRNLDLLPKKHSGQKSHEHKAGKCSTITIPARIKSLQLCAALQWRLTWESKYNFKGAHCLHIARK